MVTLKTDPKSLPLTLEAPEDPSLATPGELRATGEAITFPIRKATPEELAARKKEVVAAPVKTSKKSPRVHLTGLSDYKAAEEKLIKTNVPPSLTRGVFRNQEGKGQNIRANLTRDWSGIVTSDTGRTFKIKAAFLTNFKHISAAEVDKQVRPGEVLVMVSGKALIIPNPDEMLKDGRSVVDTLHDDFGARILLDHR